MSTTRDVYILEDGRRLVVEPSMTFRCVRLWIPGEGHIITVPIEHADGVAKSIQTAAADVASHDRLTSAEG